MVGLCYEWLFLPKVGAFSSFSGFSSCSWSGWSETGSETWWCRTVIDYGFKQSISCKANLGSVTNLHIQLCVTCDFAFCGALFNKLQFYNCDLHFWRNKQCRQPWLWEDFEQFRITVLNFTVGKMYIWRNLFFFQIKICLGMYLISSFLL